MSTYENAPATILVATCCACCGKPLVDSVSVETGVGPDCRKRHGFASAQSEMVAEEAWVLLLDLPTARKAIIAGDARKAANVVTHHIAAKQTGKDVIRYVQALSFLGFTKMADRIAARLGGIVVKTEDGVLKVKSPFSESFNFAVRSVPGQFWDKPNKVRVVPPKSLPQLMVALTKAFGAGTLVRMGTTIEAL